MLLRHITFRDLCDPDSIGKTQHQIANMKRTATTTATSTKVKPRLPAVGFALLAGQFVGKVFMFQDSQPIGPAQ
jgi:hypothetical protein